MTNVPAARAANAGPICAVLIASATVAAPLWAMLPFVPDERIRIQLGGLVVMQAVVVAAGLWGIGSALRRGGPWLSWGAVVVLCGALTTGAYPLAIMQQAARHGLFCASSVSPSGPGKVLIMRRCGLGSASSVDGWFHEVHMGLLLGQRLGPYRG